MSSQLATMLLLVIVFVNIGFVIYSIVAFKNEWSMVSCAWKKMEAFEQRLLYMGIGFFILIPAIKDHPVHEWYFAKVIIEILPALAGAFLVAGVLSFMRQMHIARELNA